MLRRNCLETVGSCLIGLFSREHFTKRENNITGRKQAPENQDSADVLAQPYNNGVKLVSSGKWIEHVFGFVAVGDDDEADLREMVELPEYEFAIDGNLVADPESYWQFKHGSDGRSEACWRCAVPSPGVGKHEFTVEFSINQPLQNSDRDGDAQIWNGNYERSSR